MNSKESLVYLQKIKSIFGDVKVENSDDVEKLITLGDGEEFDRYLKILDLPALILKDRVCTKELPITWLASYIIVITLVISN